MMEWFYSVDVCHGAFTPCSHAQDVPMSCLEAAWPHGVRCPCSCQSSRIDVIWVNLSACMEWTQRQNDSSADLVAWGFTRGSWYLSFLTYNFHLYSGLSVIRVVLKSILNTIHVHEAQFSIFPLDYMFSFYSQQMVQFTGLVLNYPLSYARLELIWWRASHLGDSAIASLYQVYTLSQIQFIGRFQGYPNRWGCFSECFQMLWVIWSSCQGLSLCIWISRLLHRWTAMGSIQPRLNDPIMNHALKMRSFSENLILLAQQFKGIR